MGISFDFLHKSHDRALSSEKGCGIVIKGGAFYRGKDA